MATAWRDRLAQAAAFEIAWGAQARTLRWTDADLYGLHPVAPLTRLDAMGAAFCGLGAAVVAVAPDAVVLRCATGPATQHARKPTLAAAPAWVTFGAASEAGR